jgi:hypothetical protein
MTTTIRTLSDATDARHLRDALDIARERKADAKLAVEATRFELRRWTRLLRSVEAEAKTTINPRYDDVLAGYRDDVRHAQELHDYAVAQLAAL